jgi:hypothetical protein
MTARTIFLAKLIGLYCILVSLAMAVHEQLTIETLIAMMHDAPLLFVTGLVSLAAGLAMVLSHNVWSGGALPVIVTLIGWATLIKSLLILLLTPMQEAQIFLGGLHYARFFYVYAAITFVLGAYLTYAGFTASRD